MTLQEWIEASEQAEEMEQRFFQAIDSMTDGQLYDLTNTLLQECANRGIIEGEDEEEDE